MIDCTFRQTHSTFVIHHLVTPNQVLITEVFGKNRHRGTRLEPSRQSSRISKVSGKGGYRGTQHELRKSHVPDRVLQLQTLSYPLARRVW